MMSVTHIMTVSMAALSKSSKQITYCMFKLSLINILPKWAFLFSNIFIFLTSVVL